MKAIYLPFREGKQEDTVNVSFSTINDTTLFYIQI